jgi:hypothetical protein
LFRVVNVISQLARRHGHYYGQSRLVGDGGELVGDGSRIVSHGGSLDGHASVHVG